jgi:hypothetical protein
MKFFLLSSITLVLGAIAIQDAPAAELDLRGGSVAGVVLTSHGRPVPGARVAIAPANGNGRVLRTRTNRQGHFGFRQVPQGCGIIGAATRGHSVRRDVCVRSGQVTNIRLVLN